MGIDYKVDTLEEFYKAYRSRIDPITGGKPLFRDIQDESIWETAFSAGVRSQNGNQQTVGTE